MTHMFQCVSSRAGGGGDAGSLTSRCLATCRLVSVTAARACGCVDKDIASRLHARLKQQQRRHQQRENNNPIWGRSVFFRDDALAPRGSTPLFWGVESCSLHLVAQPSPSHAALCHQDTTSPWRTDNGGNIYSQSLLVMPAMKPC